MCDAAIAALPASGITSGVWIIATDRKWARQIATSLGAELIVLDVSADECRKRVLARDTPGPARDSRLAKISEW
jgi:hypothetical protein